MTKKRDARRCPRSPVVDFRRKPAPRTVLGHLSCAVTPILSNPPRRASNRAFTVTTIRGKYIAIGYAASVSRMSALLAASIIHEGFPKLITLVRLRSKLTIFVTRRTRLGAEIS